MNHPHIPQLTSEQLAADQERIQAAFAAFDAKWEKLHPGFGARVQAQIDAETSAPIISNHDATDQDWFGASPESTQQLVFELNVQESAQNREQSIGRSAIKRALGYIARKIGRVPARHVASGTTMSEIPQPVVDTFVPSLDLGTDYEQEEATVPALSDVRDVLGARAIIDRLNRQPSAGLSTPKHRAEPAVDDVSKGKGEAKVPAMAGATGQHVPTGSIVQSGGNHWIYKPAPCNPGYVWTAAEEAFLAGGDMPTALSNVPNGESDAQQAMPPLPRRNPGMAFRPYSTAEPFDRRLIALDTGGRVHPMYAQQLNTTEHRSIANYTYSDPDAASQAVRGYLNTPVGQTPNGSSYADAIRAAAERRATAAAAAKGEDLPKVVSF